MKTVQIKVSYTDTVEGKEVKKEFTVPFQKPENLQEAITAWTAETVYALSTRQAMTEAANTAREQKKGRGTKTIDKLASRLVALGQKDLAEKVRAALRPK